MSVFLAGLVLGDLADKSIHHQESSYEQEVIITDPFPFLFTPMHLKRWKSWFIMPIT